MAKGEVERGRFVPIEGEVLDGDRAEEISDEEMAFLNFRNSLSAGEDLATLRVSRIPKNSVGSPMSAKSIYCFAVPVDQYGYEELCEFIRENYGGGLYRLMGTKKGHRGSAFNSLIEISEPIVRKEPIGEKGPGVGSIMETVTNALMQMQERTEAMMARMNEHRGTPATAADPFALMERMVTMFGAMGLFAKPAAAPAGDFMGELQKLSQLRNMLTDFVGGGDDKPSSAESNFYDLATAGVKAITPLLTHVAANKLGAMPALPVPEATASPPMPQPVNAPPQPEPAPVSPIKRQVDMLVAQAKLGANPEELADTILNMTPDERVAELRTFISHPAVIEQMIAANADVQTYRPFFESLRAAIIAALDAEAAAHAAEQGPAAS